MKRRNRCKIIGILLIVSIILSIMIIPVGAADTNIIFSDDFAEYVTERNLSDTYIEFINSDLEYCSVGSDESLYIGLDSERDSTLIFKPLDRLLDKDIVKIEYSVKPGSGLTTSFWTYNSEDQNFPIAQFLSNNRIETWGEVLSEKWSADLWYNIEAKIDLANLSFDIKIEDENKNIICNKKNLNYPSSNLGKIGMQVWTKADGGSYFDNLRITEMKSLPYYENFSDGMYSGLSVDLCDNNFVGAENIGGEHEYAYKLGATAVYTAPRLKKMFSAPYTSGKIGVNVSIKPDSGIDTLVAPTGSNGNWMGALRFAKEGNIVVDNIEIGKSYQPGIWYEIRIVIDLNAKVFDVMVIGEDGNIFSTKGYPYEWCGDFKEIFFQIWGLEGKTSYIDNIEILENPQPIPEISKNVLPVAEDFEGYSSLNDTLTKWSMDEKTKKLSSIKTEQGYGKTLFVGLDADTDNTWARRMFDGTLTTGKIKVSADIKPGAGISSHMMMIRPDGRVFTLFFFNPSGEVYTCDPPAASVHDKRYIGTYTPWQWYHCEAIIDMDNKSLDVYYENGDKIYEQTNISYEDLIGAIEGLSGFGAQVWTKTAGGSEFDNVLIEYISDRPSLEAKDISILRDNEVQKELTNINPSSDTIKINFHAMMDIINMSKGMVTLENVTDNKEVNFSGSVNGNMYTILLYDGLSPNKNYRLKISKDSANIEGVTLGKDFIVEFYTGKGEFKMKLEGIEQNGTDIISLADLSQTQAKVKISFDNSTENVQKAVLIYSYYSGLELTKCVCKYITINENDKKGIYEDSRIVENLESIDNMKIMLWDGFENIKPISSSITLR